MDLAVHRKGANIQSGRAATGRFLTRLALVSWLALLAPLASPGQSLSPAREYRIAARYAPDLHQFVDRRHPRLDFITRYDFDGNWRADDNWVNAAKGDHKLPAFVYYAVSETKTHLYIHYAVFHPRDWKGWGFVNGGLQVLKLTGRAMVLPRYFGLERFSAAHENDVEGVLIVVERNSPSSTEGRTILAEVHRHFTFKAFVREGFEDQFEFKEKPEPLETRDERPVLYVESRGHGIRHHLEIKKDRSAVPLRYVYRGAAQVPEITVARRWPEPVGYELLSLYGTLWQQAIKSARANRTFTKFQLYDSYELADFFPDEPVRLGTALLGRKRGRFRAIAPWGWHNNEVRGQWFFDPARNITERYRPRSEFDLEYYSNRYLANTYIHPREVPLEDAPSPAMD